MAFVAMISCLFRELLIKKTSRIGPEAPARIWAAVTIIPQAKEFLLFIMLKGIDLRVKIVKKGKRPTAISTKPFEGTKPI